MTSRPDMEQAEYRGEALAARGILGGSLMGLANLVPGISGGTMLLAAGVYPQFIRGVAEVSTFRFRAKTLLTLACIIGAAVVAIVAFAGPVRELVLHHRWVMYSLFIGLTLGGVPVLWPMIRPADSTVVVASVIGIAAMAVMALVGPSESAVAADGSHPYALLFVAGIAGASAMVLPGISGGYLLLILGQYVAILTAISNMKDGVRAGDWAMVGETMHTVIPVGLGVLAGVVGVSNLVKILLERYERATLGLLLGLLLGAVLGLWPFQQAAQPQVGDVVRGVELRDEAMVSEMNPDDWPTAFFRPGPGQAAGAVGLIVAGFVASSAVARIGRGSGRG